MPLVCKELSLAGKKRVNSGKCMSIALLDQEKQMENVQSQQIKEKQINPFQDLI